MNKLVILFFSCFLIGLIFCSSCTRNEWVIDDNRDPGYDPDKKYIVYFNPRIESRYTRALTPFPANCKAQIFAFNYKGSQESLASPVYESLKAGTLTPTGSPLTLPVGSYNFYAVSTKQDSLPPAFVKNEATGLENGVDYLWSGIQNQSVHENGTVLDLTFQHCAAQLVFNIINQDTTNRIESIWYAGTIAATPSDTSVWNLETGYIRQAVTDPSEVIIATLNDLTMSFIFLPFQTPKACPLEITAVLSSGSAYMIEVVIPPIPDGYVSGHSYQYDIVYDQDTVVLNQVSIAPWIEHEEGNIDVN